MLILDFETKKIIEHEPPPLPVGVALKEDDQPSYYMAWGHPEGNNCTKEQADARMKDLLAKHAEVLCHNVKFDGGVAKHHSNIWFWNNRSVLQVHDTMFQLFLLDIHENISLKPAAERRLGMPPDEQEDVRDWLFANYKPPGGKLSLSKKSEFYWAGYISEAPASLVGPYARGDVDRTYKLFQQMRLEVELKSMDQAYQLEQRMLPHLLKAQLRGMPWDKERGAQLLEQAEKAERKVTGLIWDLTDSFIDPGSEDFTKLLIRGGHVTGLQRSKKTGKLSKSKASMAGAQFVNPQLREAIKYFNSITHAISHSYRPWVLHGQSGWLHTDFNQVRSMDDGARTGRLSCAWFLNVATKYKFNYDLLPGLPKLRTPKDLLLPIPGKYDDPLWICRDWKQQEFRILAHFEDGDLMQSYIDDPLMDYHDNVVKLVLKLLSMELPRDDAKIVNLAILYGMGLEKLAAKLGISEAEAKVLRNAIRRVSPGVQTLISHIADMIEDRGFVKTYMGARIYKEPPKMVYDERSPEGRLWDFGYKVPNHLIQRSAAEQMKEAVCIWHEDGYADKWPWILSVHDENNITAPAEELDEAQGTLGEVMKRGKFDVPMLSDLAVGRTWGTLEDVKDGAIP